LSGFFQKKLFLWAILKKQLNTMVKNKNKKSESFGEVEVALTKTEQFLESHLNIVLYVVAGIIIVVLGGLGIHKYVLAPKNIDAQEQMFAAQNYFSKDSFNLALNGDGVSMGFLDIIDEYGSTDAGNLANYYTGVSFLHIGEYEQAIKYLKKFDSDDILLAPLAKAAMGDAWVDMGKYEKAISAYKDALSFISNEFTTPAIKIKLALVYEATGDVPKAIATLEEIKKEFPNNSEITTVDKNIARLNQ
jgi:tetratricopeptide (TPR) repeat protein